MVKKTSKTPTTTEATKDQKQLSATRPESLLKSSEKSIDLVAQNGKTIGSGFFCQSQDNFLSDTRSYCPKLHESCPQGKVSIIGMGMVGSSYAYSLIQSGLAREIVIVDANKDRSHGEYLDLSHALSFVPPVSIKEGGIKDCSDSELIVICAGVSQSGPGESRLSLVMRNVAVMDKLILPLVEIAPAANILIATNPVDVLVSYCEKIIKSSGVKFRGSILGSGTVLDSARFTFLLSRHFGVNIANVHAMIIGEHGDSELPVWSLANICGLSLKEYAQHNSIVFNEDIKNQIFSDTRYAAKQIILTKGATYYAIGLSLLKITQAILKDAGTILNVSGTSVGFFGIDPQVSIGYPSIVGRSGIRSRVKIKLSEEEQLKFKKSSDVLKNIIDSL